MGLIGIRQGGLKCVLWRGEGEEWNVWRTREGWVWRVQFCLFGGYGRLNYITTTVDSSSKVWLPRVP